MPAPIVIEPAASAALDPTPIAHDWILDGVPQARAKLLAMSDDKTSRTMVWECSPGVFNWHYIEDEVVYIIGGEVFIATEDGAERRLGEGDMALFPAGSSCTWRVTQHVKKIAVLRKDMPRLFSLGVRAWHKLARMTGRYSAAVRLGA